jgi:hypothetical protein
MNDKLFEKFFENIISQGDYDLISIWLKKQPEEEIKIFLDSFNFKYSMDKRSIIEQELDRRKNKASDKANIKNIILGAFLGVIPAMLTYYADSISLIIKNFINTIAH